LARQKKEKHAKRKTPKIGQKWTPNAMTLSPDRSYIKMSAKIVRKNYLGITNKYPIKFRNQGKCFSGKCLHFCIIFKEIIV